MPLTPLQVRVAEILHGTPGSADFVLAGGGALAVLGIGDRGTKDLDWFAEQPEVVNEFTPSFVQECERAGLVIEQTRAEPGFSRFRVADATDETLVDFAWDARVRPPIQTRYGPVLDHAELAADKMLALFGRAAPRDFVDVYRLRDLFSREQLCALAEEKDRGFSRAIFADMTTQLANYERREFPVDDPTLDALHQEFDDWRHDLRIEPEDPLRHPEPTVEPPELEL